RPPGGLGPAGAPAPFAGAELLGVSELGLVGDRAAMAAVLRLVLRMPLWQGWVKEDGRVAWAGAAGGALNPPPAGRGWLPTGRPAEQHPVEAVLSGPPS